VPADVLDVDVLVVGAGPAGLRAAEVLAAAGREVLVLERHDEIGPKVCAGGLTPKAQALVDALELPADAGLTSVGHAAFARTAPFVIDAERCRVRTVARRTLGRHQATRARAAGAELRTGTPASAIDIGARTVEAGGRRVRYRTLIGADGSESRVRRALGLPSPRAYFACEYNVPGTRFEPLLVECDPVTFAAGYFWVFPHLDYTSIGCGAPRDQVAPPALHRALDERLQRMGRSPGDTPFEGATIEVHFQGTEFHGNAWLVGDAAGLPSPLTAEGIYAALVSGEEVARRILEPSYDMPRLRSWLRVKRSHHRLSARLASRSLRRALLPLFEAVGRLPWLRGRLADFYLAG
jgi:geranylgeranyl reductase